ncbi:WD40 repeat domain-containing protein [Pseudonocardia sp. KRD291]|uniref:nSTAND1 domain-containing NTPase n=1 Tax=Pseudonocardia sp. KRD291 TaxID=2792007 RepID=UPI001C4A27DD|nr:WD40 repeat domain-containing protein [Pseudonocardia sp. KRD291]MBW0102929.1 hypothetical protein [Pseudonocardia sp. KRD291]
MAAPEWFVAHLDDLRRVPASRPVSARTLADWATQVGDSEAPSRPTISRWLSGTTLPTGFQQLELMVAGVREHSRNPPRRVRETLLRSGWWRDAYERALGESGRGDTAAGQQPQIVYQGLEPFGREDADRFFGRGPAVEAMRDRLDALRRSPTGGVLMVLGQSGIGKSSVLAAGLLPAVEKHGLGSEPAAAEWTATIITPGPDPLAALATALDATGDAASDTAPAGTADIRPPADRPVLLVVDQFEEIFQVDDDVRRRFVAALVDVATSESGDAPAVVVIACRNDFYPDLRRLTPLKPALDAPFNLDPLTGDELTEAIREPARRAGITVGPDLINRVIADAGSGTIGGKLPLISHVLRQMNQAGPMTVRAYERAGGIEGAVAHTAYQAWEGIQGAGLENAALALLVRLVRVGDHRGQDTHHRLDRHEVISPDSGPTARALRMLAGARLVTVSQDTVQITHEALWREWRLLRDTIEAERTDLVRRQAIDRSARLWDETGRPDEQLLRGTLLADAHRVTATPDAGGVGSSEVTRAFLAAADAHEHRLERRGRRMRATAISVVAVIVALAAFAGYQAVTKHQSQQRAILAEVLAQAKSLRQTDPSLAAQLWLTAYRMQPSPELYTTLLDTENQPLARPLRGHRGVARAVTTTDSTVISGGDDGTIRVWPADPGASLPASTLTAPGPVNALAVVPGRPMLVSSVNDAIPGQSALRVWDVADPRRPVALTPELPSGATEVTALTVSPDGRLLFVMADDGTVRLWNITDPSSPLDLGTRLSGVSSKVYGSGLVVSPDGRTLAAAGDAGTTRLWDISDPSRPVALPPLDGGTARAQAVSFGPTGKILASGGVTGALRLWDTADPARPRLLSEPEVDRASSILATAISPDGSTLAAASSDSTVTLWNIADPARPIPLGQPLRSGSPRGVGSVQFSPDGRRLTASSGDGTLQMWSLPATRLTTTPGTTVDLAFSRTGRTLAVGVLDDNSVHLWDTTDPSAPTSTGPPLPQGGSPRARGFNVDFARDGAVLVGSGGQTVRLWDTRDPRRPTQLGLDLVLPTAIGGQGTSPDGQTLALGGADGVTRLLDLTDPARPVPLPVTLPGTPGQLVDAVQFSPDGRTLATAGHDDQVRLWDTSDPTRANAIGAPLLGHTDNIYGLAFSPDSKRLASAGFDHSVRIWDTSVPASTRELGPPLTEQSNVLGEVSWSADGATLAAASHDNSVALWNVADPTRAAATGSPLTGHTDNAYSAEFAPTGPVLASGSRDRTVLLRNLDVNAAIQRVCAATPDTLTREAWDAYVSPDQSYEPPCETAADEDHPSRAAW